MKKASDEPWWYRVAEDPEAALEELAKHHGITVEQLKERHKRIAEMPIDELPTLEELRKLAEQKKRST